MRKFNTALGTAIAAALSVSAQTAYGDGELTLHPDAGGAAIGAITYASEQFVANETIVDLRVDYKFLTEQKQTDTFDINVIYTLSGATLARDLVAGTDFQAKDDGGGAIAATTPVGGKDGDSNVTVFLQTTKMAGAQTKTTGGASDPGNAEAMFLKFDINNATGLETGSDTVKMSVELKAATGAQLAMPNEGFADLEIAKSSSGVNVTFEAAQGTAEIDVSKEGGVEFTGTDTTAQYALLGTLELESPYNNAKRVDNPAMDWTLGTDAPTVDDSSLTITNGNFAASVTGGTGKVFLDLNNNLVWDDGIDIAADTVTESEATWTLSNDEIADIVDVSGPVGIVICADGTQKINDHPSAPQAVLTLKLTSDANKKNPSYSGKLRHIKRNGAVCTLHNIPAPGGTDILSVRITNTSANAGTVLGTLCTAEGDYIFIDEPLVDSLEPHATVRITAEQLDEITKETDWLTKWRADTDGNPEGKDEGWPGRAKLIVGGSLRSMEVFGLLRTTPNAPNMNMSLGASGDGCD